MILQKIYAIYLNTAIVIKNNNIFVFYVMYLNK